MWLNTHDEERYNGHLNVYLSSQAQIVSSLANIVFAFDELEG